MDIEEAFEMVLELAQQNVIDDPEMKEESNRQQLAIDTVQDFAMNNIVR